MTSTKKHESKETKTWLCNQFVAFDELFTGHKQNIGSHDSVHTNANTNKYTLGK